MADPRCTKIKEELVDALDNTSIRAETDNKGNIRLTMDCLSAEALISRLKKTGNWEFV